MQDEGLEESEAVRDYLKSAIYWNQAIMSLNLYPKNTQIRLTKLFTEYKIKKIWLAIDIARFEKQIGHKIFEEGDLYLNTIAEERMKEYNF